FFSSRRRHTRFSRDWSSDVCSSDLASIVVSEHLCDDERAQGLVVRDCSQHPAKGGHNGEEGSSPLEDGPLCYICPICVLDEGIRSEERRVGKEGRSRGALERRHKKT